MKPVRFVGDTLQAIRNFPVAAKNKAGYQRERVQRSLDPQDWKPITSIGAGVREFRVRDESGFFFFFFFFWGGGGEEAHAFQKTTRIRPEATSNWRRAGSAK